MKKYLVLIILISYFSFGQSSIPSLYIKSGETKKMFAQKYTYDTIQIDFGGKLVISENSSRWAIFKCNILILNGEIEYKKFRRGLNIIKGSFNDISFEYDFPESSLGGAGSSGLPVYKGLRGGKGHIPNNANGGGGGSGAWYQVDGGGNKELLNGNDATSYRGALFPSNNAKYSGDGGKLEKNSNGGLLCIITNSLTAGKKSNINLDGEKGANGGKGKKSYSDSYRQAGGSGNGGGSAGGDGGVCLIYFKTANNYPEISVRGGLGGLGGKLPPNHRILDGENGENGSDGYYEFNQME